MNKTSTSIDNSDRSNDAGDGVSEKRRVSPNASGGAEENSYEEMTMAEIMTGKGGTSQLLCGSFYFIHALSSQLTHMIPSVHRLLPWSNTTDICLPRPYPM